MRNPLPNAASVFALLLWTSCTSSEGPSAGAGSAPTAGVAACAPGQLGGACAAAGAPSAAAGTAGGQLTAGAAPAQPMTGDSPAPAAGEGGSAPVGQGGMAGVAGMDASGAGGIGVAGTGGEAGAAAGSAREPPAGTGGASPTASECPGGEQADFALVGWATEAGGTTGGKGGDVVRVSDGAALQQALKDKQDSAVPLTILVSGTITEGNSGVSKIDVKDVRDVSILGEGGGAELDGIGVKIVRASNIVVRNLRIHHVDIGDKDGISIEGPADHIWIDHCEISAELQGVDKDYYDGLIDAKAESEYITYSWNYLHDSWKTALVGSSESDTFDRKLTLHHNHFQNCNSRLPLFRGGNGHVFSNYYEDVVDTGINARIGACLRVENNFFRRAHNPWVSAYSDELGAAELLCNVTEDVDFAYSDDVRELPACTASVPYDYASVLSTPEAASVLVPMHAGVGKLDDPQDF